MDRAWEDVRAGYKKDWLMQTLVKARQKSGRKKSISVNIILIVDLFGCIL